MLFADDIVLMAEKVEDLQKLMNEITRFSEELEIKFGINKCKILIANDNGDRGNINIKLAGKTLEIVEEYKYLGIIVESQDLKKERKKLRWKAERNYQILNSKPHF